MGGGDKKTHTVKSNHFAITSPQAALDRLLADGDCNFFLRILDSGLIAARPCSKH